ncbi:MAG TPA: hypothetical protein VGG28_10500 [Kofleriaceae bacterium]|jgi:hypothetical protein
MTNSNNRLNNIATRQRRTRSRDILFAAAVALATIMSITSVATACDAAKPAAAHIAQR